MTAQSLDLSKVQFPEVMDLTTASLYLGFSTGYLRARAASGELKGTKDATSKQWSFTMKDLDEFKARPRKTGGGGPRGDGKYWLVHVKYDKLEAVKKFLEGNGMKLEPRYKAKKKVRKQVAPDAGGSKNPTPIAPSVGRPNPSGK